MRSQFETRHRRKDGTIIDVEVSGYPLELDGQLVLFNSSRDITERSLLQQTSRQNERYQRALLDNFPFAVWLKDTESRFLSVNAGFARIFGFKHADELIGKNDFDIAPTELAERYRLDDQEVLAVRKSKNVEELIFTDGGYKWFETFKAPVEDDNGELLGTVGFARDITELKNHQHQLEYIAHYDALTSLPNRILLADRLQQGMTHALRHSQLLAVVYLDLDGFKVINDKYGHDAGDRMLISVASGMRQVLREGDTLARLGGDEFVAVLIDLSDDQASYLLLQRLLAAASQPLVVDEFVLQVSASLGVTFYPQSEEVDADQLLRQADQAMYQAKLAGKNRYHIFDAQQDSYIRGLHENIEQIRHALNANDFILFYQPKVNMRSGDIIGVEALIRWQHPERGLLPPLLFLPVIEDHPLAVDIGEWVIETALIQVAQWRIQGLDIIVSVNVGARQLQQSNFVERLLKILARYPHISPNCLQLEVLETSALEDVAQVSEIIQRCRAIGISFALDDFGTGYSSLTYLKRLPVTQLKIDQSFVRDMLQDPDDLAILEGVLGLANAFRRQVIAEGVETVAHGEMLIQLGCELAQGYGIAHPMPAEQVPTWCKNWCTHSTWANLNTVANEDFPLLFAIVEMHAWLATVENHFNGMRISSSADELLYSRFHNWLTTKGYERYVANPVFTIILTLYSQLQTMAATLYELHACGMQKQAQAGFVQLQDLVNELLTKLQILLAKN